MSYTKQTWANGDIITAAKLNHIEDGIAAVDQKIDETVEELSTEYAKSDGSYEGMTVGNAEQLVATVGIDDSVPYTFRTSGGSADIGDRLTEKIVGGTIAWNQLYGAITGYDISSGDATPLTISVSNGYINVSGTPTELVNIDVKPSWFDVPANHVYLLMPQGSGNLRWSRVGGLGPRVVGFGCSMSKHTANFSGHARLLLEANTAYNGSVRFNGFDLTQMFGSTIADYIYSLEQANAGAGVAFFRKLFPKPYYEYNAGELLSVNASAHKMVGFNAWDEEWFTGTISTTTGVNVPSASGQTIASTNYIPVLPEMAYYFHAPANMYVFFYDADYNFLGYHGGSVKGQVRTIKSIPSSNASFETACYMKFRCDCGTTYKNDICINLHWDGERDGEYAPYVDHTYPLDSSLTLRGIPKLSADNTLYYDGDTYESDGKVTRKYGVVDLGTQNWETYSSPSSGIWRTSSLSNIKIPSSSLITANAACSKYIVMAWGPLSASYVGYFGISSAGQMVVIDTSYSTAESFKTAMSGVYLVYELAEPTTESADPYQNPQVVDDFGTEEYIVTEQSGVAVPVGHETTYQANLRAKLEMAPDSPDGDGDYIVRQSNGQNSYVPITFPADELPAAPTTDGNYVLKCTVADGTATFTWATA